MTKEEKAIERIFYLGEYDSRRPGTRYAQWTHGYNYCFVFSDGTKYGIGSRYGNGYYTESVDVPNLEESETIPIGDVDSMVRGKVNAKFGIDTLTDRERKQIALEKEEAVISATAAAEKVKYHTRQQALLADDNFVFPDSDLVTPDESEYFPERGKEFVRWSEIPPGTLIRNLRFNYWNWGEVRYWQADCLTPWSETTWGSKEAYEADIKAEAERAKAEREAAIAAEKELRKKHVERVFSVGKKLGIPYSFVARCHANEEYLANAVKNIRAIVEYAVPVNEDLLVSDNWDARDAELQRLGFGSFPDFMPSTAEYLLECLKAGKLIKKI